MVKIRKVWAQKLAEAGRAEVVLATATVKTVWRAGPQRLSVLLQNPGDSRWMRFASMVAKLYPPEVFSTALAPARLLHEGVKRVPVAVSGD
jgi:hypothetical protein